MSPTFLCGQHWVSLEKMVGTKSFHIYLKQIFSEMLNLFAIVAKLSGWDMPFYKCFINEPWNTTESFRKGWWKSVVSSSVKAQAKFRLQSRQNENFSGGNFFLWFWMSGVVAHCIIVTAPVSWFGDLGIYWATLKLHY